MNRESKRNKAGIVIFLMVLTIFPLASYAQSISEFRKHAQSRFQKYKQDHRKDFVEFWNQANSEFTKYMREPWKEFGVHAAIPMSKRPKPKQPVIVSSETLSMNERLSISNVISITEDEYCPEPLIPSRNYTSENTTQKTQFQFNYYGYSCEIPLNNSHRISLSGVSESNIADGWRILSQDKFLPIISRCLYYRDKLGLNDWGYVRFVEKMVDDFFNGNHYNEGRLMQMFILTQSGYKVRIARSNDKLVVLLPSREEICKYPYLKINGENYYIIDKKSSSDLYNVYDREFPMERYFSLKIDKLPILPKNCSKVKCFKSGRDSVINLNVSVNSNLISFFKDYPLSNQWWIYSNASLSRSLKDQLYPDLKRAIADSNILDATNVILHFVQTAFDYMTDGEQFGEERPLFGDEVFFYPYSDCEDRAILFSILVRELLGLDLVFLDYSTHLATAVCFGNDDIKGDYLIVEGRKYIVCDPTYINSDVGQSMPEYKRTPVKVISNGSV